MSQSYTSDLPGGTATTAIVIRGPGTLKAVQLTVLSAAAGKVEVSRAAASQIGTAQPSKEVLARISLGAGGATVSATVELAPVKFSTLDTLYVHSTGAGNLGNINFVV